MASSTNGTGNLVDEFEESFQECVHALTKQEASTGVEKDEIGMEVDLTTMKFIDLARQMEAFFIQKRFLLSALKPQLVLKEENVDLRWEINRKDEMIKKHYESIERWKNMLSDTQPQHMPHPSPQQPPMPAQLNQIPQGGIPPPHAGMMGANPMNMPLPSHSGPMPMPGIPMQQQQQHMMQAQQMHMQQMQLGKLAKR
ncbi:mediator of RNA polymerase II transcription subunit 28 isoform X1 [Contarinia nasturtii]|uniref:mediator of RNA polymerase II transcription subunit 28 isoform X1 n=1 Tax=Contarinia nasturtii TaxID=265458 RepID=UPI0012D48D0C|nr:mediator of RNA polymerase II transcription subunit 28 isoform X1 [Contarinia nasturtii]